MESLATVTLHLALIQRTRGLLDTYAMPQAVMKSQRKIRPVQALTRTLSICVIYKNKTWYSRRFKNLSLQTGLI